MKKFIPVAMCFLVLGACNSSTTAVTDTDTMVTEPVAPQTVYVPVEGDAVYRDNKVLVMRNGEWVEVEEDVTMDNGVVVAKTGRARKDGVEIELKEGEVVTKTGNFFDRTGRAIDNAWQDTKEAVKDAGDAVGDAAKKSWKGDRYCTG